METYRQLASVLLLYALHTPAAVLYVNVNSTNPVSPYAGWSTAAVNIQDGVDAAQAGDLVLVNDGTYQSGGHLVVGTAMNRVALTRPITVQSVNGPAATTILGDVYPHYAYGCRCAYVGDGATLSGFTLSSGRVGFGSDYHNFEGGGVLASSTAAVLTNCVLSGNTIYTAGAGGGAFSGKLINCVLSGNSVPALTQVTPVGGGAYTSTLMNCLVVGNSSDGFGGGAHQCTLYHCTVVGNYGAACGGAADCYTYNSIVCFNTCNSYYGFNPNYLPGPFMSFANSCTTPDPGGTGNLAQDPLFVEASAGNYRLQTNSPCINAGNNAWPASATDLDGNPRIQGRTVDMGAFEFQYPTSAIAYAWLQQYNLPTDGTVDLVDGDGDGMNNWQEWVAGTNPTNALSVLELLCPSNSAVGLTLTWQSVGGKTYSLERSSSLGQPSAFVCIQSNLLGQADTTSFVDTNATGPGPFFYRVAVQP